MTSESNFQFGTKAEVLGSLSPKLTNSSVPLFTHFTVGEWRSSPQGVLDRITSSFAGSPIAVRSSCKAEDTGSASMAGKFQSVLEVNTLDASALQNAIATVISSYEKSGTESPDQDQVICQKMVSEVGMSGVVFTQDMNTGAPYYVINYDDHSGSTESVTAGNEFSNKTLLVHREMIAQPKSDRFRKLISVLKEIESLTGEDSLDIEFAQDLRGKFHVLQVRQITTKANWNRGLSLKVNRNIERVYRFLQGKMEQSESLAGRSTILGGMPDWNPNEMIGSSPRPLAFSLYRELITRDAWRNARGLMGYNNPKGQELMYSLCGKPFIDVRNSFNSFLSAGLPSEIAEKLVNSWIDHLEDNHEFHDKIEFKVATTGLFFDFDESINQRFPGCLTEDETECFKESVRRLTNTFVNGETTSISSQLGLIQELEAWLRVSTSQISNPDLAFVRGILEQCKSFGTIPFSILARHAFVGTSFLKSMLSQGIINEEEQSKFLQSIETVTSELVKELKKVQLDESLKGSFNQRFGHLRPGTYDILSLRYDQRSDLFSNPSEEESFSNEHRDYTLPQETRDRIDRELTALGLTFDCQTLLNYIGDAIKSREYAKLIFTKAISEVLETVARWGVEQGLNREELSFLQIEDILNTSIFSTEEDLEEHLRNISKENQQKYEVTKAIRLPHLITTPEDAPIVPLLLHQPNFVTQKTAKGPFVVLTGQEDPLPDIDQKIVLIESADPGFDWIFSYKPHGLITKFGGANSHMAIRCAEFAIPAAIGCGDQIFDRILRSEIVEIQCAESRILTDDF